MRRTAAVTASAALTLGLLLWAVPTSSAEPDGSAIPEVAPTIANPGDAVVAPEAATGTTFGFVGRARVDLQEGEESDAEVASVAGNSLYVIDRVLRDGEPAPGVRIFDISDPAVPERGRRIDLSAYGADINSVAARGRFIVAAMQADPKTDPGQLVVMRRSGAKLKVITTAPAGALPDMVGFSPDGRYVLAANEGEPSSYEEGGVDPVGSLTYVNVRALVKGRSDAVRQIGFTRFNSQREQLIEAGVRIFGPGATVAQDLEPEYVTFDTTSPRAWVTLQENNALATIDLARGRVTSISALGLKDHDVAGSGIDASDRDDRINITTWPVKGMYQPDAIASYVVDGRPYLVTANEGDAREYDGFAEEVRVGDDEYPLNPAVFGDVATLKENENLGRLTVTTAGPAMTGDLYDEILAFGGRSVSIWDARGRQTWDSGDALEAVTAARLPRWFNSTNDESNFDNRSDNKGPEPEGVAVGSIGGRTYAFVAIERIGGLAIFDVTNPKRGRLTQYLNTRDFLADPRRTDSGAEAVTFVSASDSPNGKPLVAVSNEVSGTVTLWQPVNPDGATELSLLHNNDGESALFGEPVEAPDGTEVLAGTAGAFSTMSQKQVAQARNRGNSIVNVYAGDSFLASALLSCSLPPNPDTTPVWDGVAQRLMPYDVHVFGNHEFDYGPAFLKRYVDTFTNGTSANQPFISGNLDFGPDASWASSIAAGGIVTHGEVVNGRVVAKAAIVPDLVTGQRFGIVSATTWLLENISSPAPVAVTTGDLAETAATIQEQVDRFTGMGITKIILVSHLQNVDNDKALVGLLEDVDIAVAGGGDELLANPSTPLLPGSGEPSGPYPTLVADSTGSEVPIVTTEGNYTYLGRLDVVFNRAGEVTRIQERRSFPRRVVPTSAEASALGIVDAVPSDELVDELLEPAAECLDALADPIAASEITFNVSRSGNADFGNGVRNGETNGGDLVTDGYLAAYDRYAQRAGLPARSPSNLVAAVQNGGGIRQNGGDQFPAAGTDGLVSREGTRNVLPFDNTMTVITGLTAAQMKEIFERSVASQSGADCATGSGGQFLQVANLRLIADCSRTGQRITDGAISTPGDRVLYLAWDPGTPGDLTDDIAFVSDGRVVTGAPTISLVTNNFTAAGGDEYLTFAGTTQVQLGATYEQTLVEYILSFPSTGGYPTIPSSDTRYASPTGEGRITFGS